jgi:Reverse transcriptase (RNA-dependent DNA polymerase)
LGVPTVGDRIAQMVIKQLIEPELDQIFLPDSYGYRPGKSALDAVGVTRQRCWKYDWVLEFDIKGLFDNISHELLLKAVRKHVQRLITERQTRGCASGGRPLLGHDGCDFPRSGSGCLDHQSRTRGPDVMRHDGAGDRAGRAAAFEPIG